MVYVRMKKLNRREAKKAMKEMGIGVDVEGYWELDPDSPEWKRLSKRCKKTEISPVLQVVHGRVFAERIKGCVEPSGREAWVNQKKYWEKIWGA